MQCVKLNFATAEREGEKQIECGGGGGRLKIVGKLISCKRQLWQQLEAGSNCVCERV